MAHLVATDARTYVNEWDLSPHVNSLGLTLTQDARESTTFGSGGARTFLPGLRTGTFNVGGYQDFADDAAYEQISSLSGTAIFSFVPETDVEGGRSASGQFIRTAWTPLDLPLGDVAGLSMTGQPTAAAVPGYILHPKTARSSSSTTTGVQVGALAGGTGYAALHVFAGTASTLDVVIQSDDNSGFTSATNRITFTQATGPTSQWATVTSAGTDDYWRVSWTVGGGTWTFAVTFGIV